MRFRLLGSLEVTDGSGALRLGGPKQRLVLAHLLLRANQVVPADLLIDEVWGDEPPAAARATLQGYVSHLRRALGAGRLTGRPSGYLLSAEPNEIDARRFESLLVRARRTSTTDPAATARLLREAEGLWQGDALADLSGELSLWPEIERLTEMRLGALEDLAHADLQLGRHRDVAADLERLQRTHPLREGLCAQLMLALYRSGRQTEALAVYGRLRSALDEELGVEPSPALERLQRQILNHDPALELRGLPLRGYRLIEEIGSGRYGTVHRALEPHAEREVAIKVLGARVANDADMIRRFDSAARRVARLEHPHVVQLHDWWREPDRAHLVMRLMEGGSLARRLVAGEVGEGEALLWAEQVASALAAAHRRGIAHGSIRPDDVMLDADGNAYLTDFVVAHDPARNGAGSAEYLAPERRTGAPPSAPADVYAFGALVSRLIEAAGTAAPVGALAGMLADAMSTDAARRPSTPTEIVDAMRQSFLGGHSVDARDAPDGFTGPNPYKGLRAFEEADAEDFFGREELVGQLVARMGETAESARLLGVVGPSGSGKSSLVAAGLVPALRAGALNGSEGWFVVGMTPGAEPFEELERALETIAVPASSETSTGRDSDRALLEAVEGSVPEGTELLLVIDQFEELFTLAEEADANRFLAMLAAAVADPRSRVRVVITLRADFYDRPLGHERFGGQLAARTHAVGPLAPEQLARAVLGPAERVGLRLEEGLVARMVTDVSDRPGMLPLLQHALSELWERRDGSRLTVEAYVASGGIAAAVGRRAEQVVLELDEAGRETARQLFLRLVEPGEGTEDTARRVLRADLLGLAGEPEIMATVIDRFARYRMLLLDRDPQTRGPTVELAHEALLRAWPRLRGWVDTARDDLRRQRLLAAAASQWTDGNHDPSFLLSGSRLERTAEWAGATELLLGPAERMYLDASTAQARRIADEEGARREHELALERRAMTRLRGLVVALGIGALVAGGLSVFASVESARAEREARTATGRELAAAAVADLSVDPERSILLALEAVRTTRSVDAVVLPEAEDALHRAVAASRLVDRVPSIGVPLAWSPDGTQFVSEGVEGGADSGLLDLLDVATGESAAGLWKTHHIDVNVVAFSPDGSLLLTTGDDGTAAMWDLGSGQELRYRVHGNATPETLLLRRRLPSRSEVWGPAFSPDGTLAAAVWPEENLLRIWDALSGDALREIPVAEQPSATSFSPDGKRLAIVLRDSPAVVVLDVESGELLPDFWLEHDGQFAFDAAWSPDGKWIATAGRVPAVRIWHADTGLLEHSLLAHEGQALLVRWSPDSAILATGGADGSARLWQVAEDIAHEVHSVASLDTTVGVDGMAFSPDGERLMTGGQRTGGMQVWDVSPRGESEWLTHFAVFGPQGGIGFFPDGRFAASNAEGTVTVSDLADGRERTLGIASAGILPAIAVSPTGDLIATAGGEDDVARVYTASGQHRFDVVHQETVLAVAWNADASLFATADNSGLVRVVDTAGEEIARLMEHPNSDILAVRFSPDGRWLAVVHEGRAAAGVAIWDWAAGEIEMELPQARDVAFDSTGTRLVTAGWTTGVEVWALSSGRPADPHTLPGGVSLTWGVAWSPDDSTVAAGSNDGLVRLWDVESGAPGLVLRGHTAPVSAIEFSPDGARLASRSMDGTARVWALDLDDLIGLASGKLHRSFSDAECLRYLRIPACPAGD